MAEKPYRIIDRRHSALGNTNTLIEAATQTTDRKSVPMLDQDVHRTITHHGRRVLMSLGRHMFWRFPALQGMILEQANLAVETFIPQFMGADKAWGEQAEELLREWHRVMDVAGAPYDYDSFLAGKIINPIVDGEDFTLLTQNADGYPLTQIIPCHRIGGRNTCTAKVKFSGKQMFIDNVLVDDNRPYEVVGGPIEFEATVMDGVVVDQFSRALAYRVYADARMNGEYQDISARNLFPAFTPIITGQVRGFSLLASSVFDWQDLSEWSRFEMLAQKVFASQTIMEWNEAGEMDTAKQIVGAGGEGERNEDGTKATPTLEVLDGGTIKYFKSGSGGKLESFHYDRPGASSQNFVAGKLRDAFKGTEWDVFFSLDPQAVGGAPMRVIVEKINAVLRKKRKLVGKACRRVDGYALARFMKLGILPFNAEWYKWEYQGPGDVTADKKYDSDVDLQEISQGLQTRKGAIARRGQYIEEVDAQREREADSDLERASRLAKKHNITIQEALAVLRPVNQHAQMPPAQTPPNTTDPVNPS
jgi:hypothetical protein